MVSSEEKERVCELLQFLKEKRNNFAFAEKFLKIIDDFDLWEKIVHATSNDQQSDGKTVFWVLTKEGSLGRKRNSNPLMSRQQLPDYNKDVELRGKKYWIYKDFRKSLVHEKLDYIERIKMLIAEPLGIDSDTVDEWWRSISANRAVEIAERGEDKLPMSYSRNRIFFGAPGTGKSYKLNEERKTLLGEENKANFERVTFHPEYSYAHFVGTYKPVPKGEGITYSYVPGPFLRVYVDAQKAYMEAEDKTQAKPYLLIIEEINRANVAAVFGDVFQLLDRKENGESEYPIAASEDVHIYLKESFKAIKGEMEEKGRIDEYEKMLTQLSIPPNMYIWATMNSADQGVFPMDTAFKRRWDFEYIGINDNSSSLSMKEFQFAGGTVKWDKVRTGINDWLASEKINEDKQLGPFFLSPQLVGEKGDDDPFRSDKFVKAFKSKVIMYLFEDAAKQKRNKLFKVMRYSEICKAFDSKGLGVFLPPEISDAWENRPISDSSIEETSGDTEQPASDSGGNL